MARPDTPTERLLDVVGLGVAGLVNTLLAPVDFALVLAPGTLLGGGDLATRSAWIAAHTARWQAGWAFWFVVTTTFTWSFYALARHLRGPRQFRDLPVGMALLAAAVDLVGVVLNSAVAPQLALTYQSLDAASKPAAALTYLGVEALANALTNVTAFGLYTAAGLLLLPALFATTAYPRWLAWLGVAEWGISALTTVLLVLSPSLATGPLLVGFALYAPWVWGSAWWLLRGR